MTERFARFVIRQRLWFLLGILAVTGFFAWKAFQVEVKSLTIDLFPTDHEFVETFVEYREIFGGASSVIFMLEVKDGDIYNPQALGKLRSLTKAIELLPAINNYQVLSLAQRKVRDIRVDEIEGFTSTPIMWPNVPESEEELRLLIQMLKANPRYHGKLVSLDGKAALIVAGFFAEKLDFGALFQELRELEQYASEIHRFEVTACKGGTIRATATRRQGEGEIQLVLFPPESDQRVAEAVGQGGTTQLSHGVGKAGTWAVRTRLLATGSATYDIAVQVEGCPAVAAAPGAAGPEGAGAAGQGAGGQPGAIEAGEVSSGATFALGGGGTVTGLTTRSVQIEDANTTLHIIGRPVMLGSILDQYPQLKWLFLATILAMLLTLVAYFRTVVGVLVPMLTAILSAFWGIGILALLDFNFDPLIIVIPFIISARALSHSVQLINRYLSEYDRERDRKLAAEKTLAGLWKPGLLAIITDAAGVLVVWLTPIPLMQKLAIMGGYWVMSIIVTDMIFNPIFLSYMPAPRRKDTGRGGLVERALRWIGAAAAGRHVWAILGITGITFVVGFLFARNLVIGDVHPGTPMLWPDSEYNRATESIAHKFGNTEMFNVIVEGESRDAIKSPPVLRNMEGLQRALEDLPVVSASLSIADLLPGIIAAIHGGDPKWELIPLDRRESGFFLNMVFSAAEPGDLADFITQDSRDANIRFFLHDHKGTTLRQVVAAARDYISANPFPMERRAYKGAGRYERFMIRLWEIYLHDRAVEGAWAYLRGQGVTAEQMTERIEDYVHVLPLDRATFRLAAGYGGLLAAVNEVIIRTEALVTGLAFLVVFVFCAVAYRSVVAGLLFLAPLAISNYLTYALMGALEIGLDVNSLPVVALGVGLGVDYGLYVVGRIEEEFRRSGDLAFAIMESLSTAGKAVFFTAATMVVGVVFWAFSFLRFQADMGILLVFWMAMSALGGLILLPTLIWLIKPKFLTRRTGIDVKAAHAAGAPTPAN